MPCASTGKFQGSQTEVAVLDSSSKEEAGPGLLGPLFKAPLKNSVKLHIGPGTELNWRPALMPDWPSYCPLPLPFPLPGRLE